MSVLDLLLGKRLASHEEEEHKVGVLEGIPMLGLDALGSSAYGPEAALTVLIPLGALSLQYVGPIILVILAILAVLYFSYRQTIAAYPNGGGSYTVAKENLGARFGLLAAAALLLDYVLNVAVGVSAGVAALVSAVPALHGHILSLCLAVLALVALVNLRGIRESGVAWALPTYLFVGSMGVVLGMGVWKTLAGGGHPAPVAAPPPLPAATERASLWLLVRAFASGCTAMTGVEAVSNGVTAFAEPAVRKARGTLSAIVAILGALLLGIAFLARAYGVGAMDQDHPGYQSVISQIVGAVVGRGWGYYVTIGSVLAVLCLSANTSFADFPRLCHLIAEDAYLPHVFANKGRRLVYSMGIGILTVLSGILLVVFGGITDRLIPLFAVGAFLAFTLSQAGMVVHWRREGGPRARSSLLVNGVGAAATGVALAVVLVAKFREGAWITVLLVPMLLFLFRQVKRHYEHVRRETCCPRPLDATRLEPVVAVLPITGWSTVTEKALRFALRLTPDLIAVHVSTDEEEQRELREQWKEYVEAPLRAAGLPQPRLEVLSSPYRHLVTPLLKFLRGIEAEDPSRQVAVVIPELVEARWWEYLLHNQRATLLKAALLFRGGPRIVVINVPWYVEEPPDR
jgi:amino acid transporter